MSNSKKLAEVCKDDVARLIRGRPSKNRVGSRNIRHRLRQDELERLAVARSRGYLLLTTSTRTALQNSWFLDCTSRNVACVFVERTEEGLVVTRVEGEVYSRRLVTSTEELSKLVQSH